MVEMKKLIIGDDEFEVVDEQARSDIAVHESRLDNLTTNANGTVKLTEKLSDANWYQEDPTTNWNLNGAFDVVIDGETITDFEIIDAFWGFAATNTEPDLTTRDNLYVGIANNQINYDIYSAVDRSNQYSWLYVKVKVNAGASTGDPELVDIRVGADGTTYASAGDAVRGQVGVLESNLNNLMNIEDIPVYNQFYAGNIDASGAEITRVDNKTFICNYVDQQHLYNIKVNSGYTVTVFYYDNNKSFINYVVRYTGTFPITNGNGYIRLRVTKGTYQVFTALEARTQSHMLYRYNAIEKVTTENDALAISKNRLKSYNIVNGYIHDGYHIDINGNLIENATADWSYTDFIQIKPNTIYYMYSFTRKNKLIANSYLNYYDAYQNRISSIQLYDRVTFTTPENACYMRISCSFNEIRYIYVTDSDVAPLWYMRYGQDTPVNVLTKYHRNNYANILSISKDGINTLAGLSGFPVYPHCSKYSYISAIYEGFDALLLHVMKTSDDKFVLSHENNLYTLAKNDNGSALSNPYNISDHTLAELKTIDMGYDYGEMYRGTRLMTLDEGLTLVKKLNVYLVIEPSGLTKEQYLNVVRTVKKYGFTDNVAFLGYYANTLRDVNVIIPKATLILDATGSAEYTNAIITDAINLKTDLNTVCVGKPAKLDNNMTEELVQRMIDNDISYFIANPTSEPDGFIEYMEQSPLASYVTFVDSQCIPASKMLLDNLLEN